MALPWLIKTAGGPVAGIRVTVWLPSRGHVEVTLGYPGADGRWWVYHTRSGSKLCPADTVHPCPIDTAHAAVVADPIIDISYDMAERAPVVNYVPEVL